MPTTGGKKRFPGFQHFFFFLLKECFPRIPGSWTRASEQRLFYPSLGGGGDRSFEISWKSNGASKTVEGRSIPFRCNNWYRYRRNSINFPLIPHLVQSLVKTTLLSISFASSLKIFAEPTVYPIIFQQRGRTSPRLHSFPDNFRSWTRIEGRGAKFIGCQRSFS